MSKNDIKINLPNNEKVILRKEKKEFLFKKDNKKLHSHNIVEESSDGKTIIKTILTDETKPKGSKERHLKHLEVKAEFNKTTIDSNYLTGKNCINLTELQNKKVFVLSQKEQEPFGALLNVAKGGTRLRNNPIIDFTEFDSSNWSSGVIRKGNALFVIVKKQKYYKINFDDLTKSCGINHKQGRLFKQLAKRKLK
ncbi:MAG: hypothetical protein ACTSX6_10760 [Candidatus Heimdallarchaeaceae archaeon]